MGTTYTDVQVRAAISNTTTSKVIDTVVSVDAATYAVLATDNKILVTYSATGACTVTIPTAEIAVVGRKLSILDSGGDSSTSNITVATEASETIDGAATATISTDNGSLNLVSDGSNLFSC